MISCKYRTHTQEIPLDTNLPLVLFDTVNTTTFKHMLSRIYGVATTFGVRGKKSQVSRPEQKLGILFY
jgi:hypothetical protein